MDKIETVEQFEAWLAKHPEKKHLLFKRSTRCPTSHMAFEYVQRFAGTHPDMQYAYVNVIEDRPTSNHIAAITGVAHQSPQVLLFKNSRVIWNDSHHQINEDNLDLQCTKD